MPRLLPQLGGLEDFFRWKPEHGTEILCVPIDRPSEPVRINTDAFYQWHFANAHDQGSRIVVDYIRYPSFDTFYEIGGMVTGTGKDALSHGRYHRATIDLAARTFSDERILDHSCEFPTIAPGVGRANAFPYLALDNLGGLGKLDLATGTLDAHALPATQRATEPVFVANGPGEDDGHVLSLCADGPSDRAFVAVHDAKRIAAGPVAKVWLDHSLPITFHGTFAPATK